MHKKLLQKGFTIVELVVYAAGVVLVVGLIVTMLHYSYKWYGSIAGLSRADQIGTLLSERLVRDIRDAVGVNDAQSVFGTASSSVSMSVMIDPGSSVSKTYGYENGRITYKENSGTKQYLTPTDVEVSRFTLNKLTSGNSTAIRYSFSIIYYVKNATSTATYSGLSIMRNTYE